MNEPREVELNSIVMHLESLNKKFHEITAMTAEAIHRILPDDSISESKADDNKKLSTGYIGEIRKRITDTEHIVDRCAYNLSRLQKIS